MYIVIDIILKTYFKCLKSIFKLKGFVLRKGKENVKSLIQNILNGTKKHTKLLLWCEISRE